MRLVTTNQMKKIDQTTIENGVSSIDLMENAAHALFDALISEIDLDDQLLIVCGSGNNGGDGLALARLLKEKNYHVRVNYIGNLDHASEDNKTNYERAKASNVMFCDQLSSDILIDCIFGTGLNKEISGSYYEVIKTINGNNSFVISVDIPSGINGDSGKMCGIAIKANLTYTLAASKVGLYFNEAREYVGKLSVLNIGIKEETIDELGDDIYLIRPIKMKEFLPKRKVKSNKSTYGKVLCVGGADSMSGAISLASMSALKSGCGMMCLAIPRSIREVVASSVLEATYQLLDEKDGFIARGVNIDSAPYSTILFGCGIGRNKGNVKILDELLKTHKDIVIDADGLIAYKELMNKYLDHQSIIITPHLKEFSNLVDANLEDVVDHQLNYALDFSKKYPNVTLVLKSETTVIVRDSICYINTYGNNGLAKGGSGDVLAGCITGLLAQNKNPLEAATLGVYLHARSADLLLRKQSIYSILPSEVLENIDQVIEELS